ncbi:protocadherin Fat 4-like [Argopecten irradians]|uniref:protocadherin Fat 4-like n=1 Tax=Argopecten irradians TaxID=31199 RepID=UPI003712254C
MSIAIVQVHVIDVNDHTPYFRDHVMNISIAEGQNFSFSLKAYDDDEGNNGEVYYQIGHHNTTSMHLENDELRSTTPLEYGVYEIEVIAYNPVPYSETGLRNGTLIVFMHVEDINNNSPVFTNTSYSFSLPEDFTVGGLVTKCNIHAHDADETPEYNTVTYSIPNDNGYFEIDPRNATLRLIKSLDYEIMPHINFKVVADDGDITHKVSVDVSVTVLDVNNHAPMFSSALYNCTVYENDTSPITCEIPVNATDADSGFNGDVHYLLDGWVMEIFTMDYNNGTIRPSVLLDYDMGIHSYILTVIAIDKGAPAKTGSAVVEISVQDKNDNSPVIHGPSQFSFPESAPVNTAFGTIFATDADSIDNLEFSLTNSRDFHIQPDTGILSTARIFDYEKEYDRLIHANVSVNDGQHTTHFPISVAITNVNDNSPVFVNVTLTPTISEDIKNPSFYIQATDKDMDAVLQYNISTDSRISISGSSGLVTIHGQVNSSDIIKFDVSVYDGIHLTTAGVMVHVTDVNDHAPRFENSTYIFDVDEELENAIVGIVNAHDADIDQQNKYMFYMIPTLWSSNFTINTTSGAIRTVGALDRENPSVINDQLDIIVMVMDEGVPPLTGSALVVVNINDVNDHRPMFVQSSVQYTISERQCPSRFHNLEIIDKDEGENQETRFQILHGGDIAKLVNDSLKCKNTPITPGFYNITVKATNVKPLVGAHVEDDIQTIDLHVQDVNDHNPIFDINLYSLDLMENQTLGELIFSPKINATDADPSAEYSTITYAIIQGNGSSYFDIDPNMGRLWLKSPLDYEQEEFLTLTISASDGHINVLDNKLHSATASVYIHVLDINDNKPTFTSDFKTCSVRENVTGIFNCVVKATDADAGDTERLTYYILNSSQIFDVSTHTGEISVKSSKHLDYDQGQRLFDIHVVALDGGSPQLTGSTVVSIDVVNINDEEPVFTNETYVFEIHEEEKSPYYIGHVSATDLDEHPYDRLTFSLVGFNDMYIDNTTGDLFTSVVLDYEDQNQRVITDTVIVSDGAHRKTASVTVSVTNVNDNKPQFNQTIYRADVRENTATGHVVTQVHAFDLDNLSSLQYRLEGGNDGRGAFKINTTSGEIYVFSQSCLDYERQHQYLLVVVVSDGGTPDLSSQTLIEINVIDEDDIAPIFITDTTFGVVKENEPIGTSVLQVAVYDPDTPFENVTLSVNNTRFVFDNRTLNTNSELDAEDVQLYNLIISVSDGVVGHIRSQMIQVNVSDVNDNTPAFNSTSYNGVISQNAKNGSYVLTVGASDADISNSGFTFYLSGGEGNFMIDSYTGVVRTVVNEHVHFCVNCTYMMDVHVIDYGEPPKSNSTQLVILIDTSNHNAPVFTDTLYVVNLTEHQTYNDSVISVSATDADCVLPGPCGPAGSVEYSIVSGGHRHFRIDKVTGQIYLNGTLDYTKGHNYILQVEARDQADDFKTATTDVRVDVIDINERPHFVKNVTSICSVENITAGDLVGIVTATDPDHASPYMFDKLTYTLLNENDKFHVVPLTGKIYASENVSSSVIQNIVLRLVVKDYGGLNDTTTLRLSTGTKGKPVFDKSSSYIHVRLPEDVSVPVEVTDVNTTTEDLGTISYHLTHQGPNSKGFRIDNETGVIEATEPLDRETSPNIILTVTAANSKGECSSLVDIEVLDVNDQPPIFQTSHAAVTVLESAPVGTCIETVSVMDKDSDPQLTFIILDVNSASPFGIESNNGSLSACVFIASSLDYENVTHFNLMIQVDDGIFNDTMDSAVAVQDVNDNYPFFSTQTFYKSITEDISVGTSFYQLRAMDADHLDDGKLQYSLTNDYYGQFSIRSDEGVGYVILNRHLDREVNSSYVLEVKVMDTANHTNSTSLNITILDVNDNKPEFLNDTYNVTVNEGPDSDLLTIRTEADDIDEGSNAELEYSIISQDFGHHFVIGNTTGVISVLTSLNREDTSIYTLVIQAADQGETRLSGTATVFVNVEDINDCVPEFQQTSYSASVMEGSPSGTSVIHLTAVDKDVLPINRNISYLILDNQDLFDVDDYGVLTLTHEVVLGNHPTPYHIQIEATDGEYNTTVNVTVSVTDVNDHDPVFNETFYLFSVPENDEFPHPPSVLVGSVSATDEDPGKNGEVSYSILSTEVPVFIISRENGSIITNGTLDRDRCVNSRYTFTVIATDNGNATRTGLVEVTVTISDINDNWPEFTSDHYDGNIIENSDVGTEVNIHPAILASDIDAGNNGTDGILFYLSTDSPFEINSTNGRIFVKNKELDREKQETYNLEVIAIDQLGAGNNKSVPLTITLADANDEPPVFTHNISVFTINENAKSSDLVGSIHTSDADVGGNVSTRYTIVSGGDGRFYIDPISGDIRVTGGLDREQKDNYTLTIQATDGVNSAKAEVDVIIEDANDNSPIFPSNPVVINVTESDANISRIYTFTAYDKDLGENAVLTYFINQSDADASTFYVTEDGILSTIQPIDRETVDSYSFLVHVHDNGTPSLSASVTVLCQVLDSNDNRPIFYDSNGNETTEYKTSILEKSPVGSPVFFPYVRDEDLGLNSAVHFQLLGAKRDLFQCNQKNGVVTIAKRIEINSLLDGRHDNETATYVGIILTVMATDQGQPSKSTNLTLHVTVEQISDENPVFDHELYQFNVSESTLSGSYIGDVKASMPNVSNYHLTYSIVTHSSLLILEKDQGRITLNNTLDREESDLHTFVVQVTDGKTPERTAFTMVNIRVIDVNDNAPHFNKPSYEYTITEGTYTMSTFGNVSATDRDTGRNAVIKYSLVNYTGEIFDVDISTGALVVNGTIDREENTEYTLLLQAEDQGVPALNTTVVVRVKIEDINDNSPKFLHSNYTCSVLENAPYEQICNVSATDEDQGYNGTVVYSFQDSNIPFYINPIDGTISKTGTTDFETKNIYNITIEAHDLGSPELSSSVSLVIVIGDVPDTPPHFPRRVYDLSTSSFTPLHTVLLNVTAGDGNVIYTIPDGIDDAQNTFCIDHVSGVIYLCRAMVPKQSTYVLTVEAEDANLTDTTVVVIHVRNEPASFSKSNYTADVMENHVGVLLDLNTTEELTGIPVHYTLVSVQPKDNGFIVNATTGEIYCSKELDRERVKTYTLVVSAEKVRNSDRSKRSTGESLGQVTVIVRVGDMNDNPPQFPPDTKLLYRVPSSLRVTSKVAELQAIDPDENSIVTYHLENSDELPFILRESDKAAKVLLKNHLERPSYNLTVSATDQDGYSANVTLTVITIPDTNRLTYVIPMSPQEFEKQEKKLIANLSSVLGVNVTTDGYDTHVDPSKTGLRIIARNMTTGRLLTTQELSSLISSKFADIYKLFHCTGESCYVHSKSIMTAPEIALLVIAVLIFVTGILVIFIGNHLWKQFHKAREEEMKMWELESFRSNGGSHIDNGTVNPNITNIETSFADLDNSGSVSSGLAANKKRTVLYESQELTMNFDNDAFCLEPPVTNGADSGVENDSSSNSSNTDEIEAPSPDVFRGTGSLGQTERPGRPDQGTSKSTEHALALPSQPSQASLDKNQITVLQIDMDTGDTSDDNIDTDYEEKLSINSTDSKSIRSSDPIVTSAQISEQVSSTVEIPETNVDNADIDPSVADDNIEEEMMTSF